MWRSLGRFSGTNAMKTITAKLLLFCSLLISTAVGSAQSWTMTSAPVKDYWNSIACSANGMTLAATLSSGGANSAGLYLSTNSGATWQTNLPTSLSHVAISADGTVLAAEFGGTVFVSTNGGASWQTNSLIGQDLDTIACSADGMTLLVTDPAGNRGNLIVSTNSGLTWATNALAGKNWTGVASSADGTKLIAVASFVGSGGGQVLTSTNSGTTWITNTITSSNPAWASVASSADGTKLAAGIGGSGGTVYTSPDGGNTWISNSLPHYEWNSLACSADGSRLLACTEGDKQIYTSTNFGLTWVSNAVPALSWVQGASSADGNTLVAAAPDSGIFLWQATPAPLLNIAAANGNLTFSWTVPSTNFVLQQSSDFSPGDWTTLTNLPALNLTNLLDQVSILPANGNGFFRLVAQPN